jgi:hypothetical protein
VLDPNPVRQQRWGAELGSTTAPYPWQVMADITNPKLIYLKGFLFLFTGLLASALLILEKPTWEIVLLLIIAVWCFARFYYFAFYVIEHYVDPRYRFAGLWSFVLYLLRRRKHAAGEESRSGKVQEGPGPTDRGDTPV